MRDPGAVRMPLAEALARAAVPLAGLAAMAAFASREVDPAAAAESGYLAAVATAVLAAVAFLAPAPALEAGLGAALATAAVWALPASPARGAAVLALLVAALAVAAGRRLARCPADRTLPLVVTLPLALGLQALLRGDLLLAPGREPRVFVLLLLLPLAGALSTTFLSRRHGRRAAVAAGLALAVTPGWTIATTLALAALAGGDALASTAGRSWRAAWPVRLAALAALAAPLAWGPRGLGLGLLGATAGLALASPALGVAGAAALNIAWLVFQSLGAPQLVPGIAMEDPSLQWIAIPLALVGWLATAILLLPTLVRPAPGRRRGWLAGVLLVLAARAFAPPGATAGLPSLAALAAPIALLVLAVDGARPAGAFQEAWTAALLGGTALLAAYPWLRERPLADFLALLGPVSVAAVAALAAAALAHGIGRWRAGRRSPDEAPQAPPVLGGSLAPAGIAAALLFAGILVHLPRPATPLLAAGGALRLAAGSPAWAAAIPGGTVSGVALVSTLENGSGLAAGTPVATVHLDDGGGGELRWTLAAGRDTAEWAARRADVARVLAGRGERPPPAWVSWVAGGFFAQRYRWVRRLPGTVHPVRLRIELAPGLPPDLALAVDRLEILR